MRKIILLILGFLSAFYGILVLQVGSGTGFWLIWEAIGLFFCIWALLLHKGFFSFNKKIKFVFYSIISAGLILLAVLCGLIFSKFTAEAVQDLEYIVVLGAQVREDGPSIILKYRLDTAIDYLSDHPDTICIVSGGQGANEPFSEAEGMKNYLVTNGIEKNRILLEEQSKNTVQNIRYSKQLLDENCRSIGIVTNNFHMYRAMMIAKMQGLEGVSGIAADSNVLYLPNNVLRECFGILKDWLYEPVDQSSFSKSNIKSQFSTNDLLEDYDYLWETLEEDYLLFPILEERGIHAASVKETTRKQVEEMEPDLEQYYRVLDKMFLQMDYFGHLSLIDGHTFEIYQKYYNSKESEDNGYKKMLQYEQTQHCYKNLLKTDFSIHQNVEFPEIEKRYDETKKAVIFKIKSFDSSLMERDANFIREYLETLGQAEVEHIIFDITGNVGGSDYYWMNHIVAPFGRDVTRTTTLFLKNSELTDNYFSRYDLCPINEFTPAEELPEFVSQLGITHFITSENVIYGIEQLPESMVNAKRWVLIDHRVYSSADSFANFCKSTGWATLVGFGTKGDGIGTTPIVAALPNTGLLVRFSVVTGVNDKGQLNVLYGTYPDVYSDLKTRENPLKTVYRLIEEYE